ncbi:unnamed protein product [Larinioides sclopetarius]|uniref:PDZ domain-containing protein n=1 Tax=Larinioides sclopetarius TaxID=280406 RepID=A0AAV2BGN4_9ARAC
MDLEELHFADDSADEPYEVILLPETSRKIAPENRLSPAHACLPLKALSNIQEFVETTIVLKKDKKNELGISIAGGHDSYLEQICVVEVHRDGIAYSDGRLRKGDVILAVNDISFREANLADAVRCLKETPSPVRLIILRENPQALFTTNESTCSGSSPHKIHHCGIEKVQHQRQHWNQYHAKDERERCLCHLCAAGQYSRQTWTPYLTGGPNSGDQRSQCEGEQPEGCGPYDTEPRWCNCLAPG